MIQELPTPLFLNRLHVTRAAARISLGLERELVLGNISSRRDWGFAGDYVRAMWLMTGAPAANDYVVATGQLHSVEDLCACAFSHVGLDWRSFVRVDQSGFRREDDAQLVGDPARLRRELGWEPSVAFEALIQSMVDADVVTAKIDPKVC